MNKLLVAIFDNEAAADAGLQALRHLHAAGDITLYGTGVVVKDTMGRVSVRAPHESELVGTATGLAVGSLIGLLGGPVGVALGAVTGTVLGAVAWHLHRRQPTQAAPAKRATRPQAAAPHAPAPAAHALPHAASEITAGT
jgi:hypothetical protein